ncbi:MAG: DUF1778 domain-containing protein [Rhodoglobus sp.]
MRATARLEFRVDPESRALLERAAELSGEPVGAFARAAAQERAEQVLRQHDALSIVPASFFDELNAAWDAPVDRSQTLADAVSILRTTVVRD